MRRAPELVVDRNQLDHIARVLSAGGFSVGASTGRERLRRTWLDTFDWRLHRAGLELEQVQTNGVTSFELRGLGEHELEMTGEAPIQWPAPAAALPPGAARDRVSRVADARALCATVSFDGFRQTVRVLDEEAKTIARLHVDTGPDDTSPAFLSVSPLRGYHRDARRVLELLMSAEGIAPAPTPYYDRLLEASGRRFGDTRVSRPDITGDMPAAAAIAGVLRAFLDAVQANVPGVLADVDTEFLHDLRVAVRRARSTIKLAGDVLPGALPSPGREATRVEQLANELKWLGDATTPTRDLDVYVLGVPAMARRLRAASPSDLDAFRAHLAAHRSDAFDRLTAALDSERFAVLIETWTAESTFDPDRVAAGPSAVDFGAARLRRAHRRVLRLGSTITRSTPAERLHALRKRCKELRYLLEIFEPIEPPRTRKRVLPALRSLQQCLGEFQDSEVQAGAIRSFAAEMMAAREASPPTLLAMGELAAQLDADQEHARRAFAGTFKAFTRATRTPRWTAPGGARA